MAVPLRMFTVAPPVSDWLAARTGTDAVFEIKIIVLRPAHAGFDASKSASQDVDASHLEQSSVFVLGGPSGLSIPHGRCTPDDKSVMHAVARVALEQTGFTIERVVAILCDATFVVRRSRSGEAPLPRETIAMWLQAAELQGDASAPPELAPVFEWARHLGNIEQFVSNEGVVVRVDEDAFPLAQGIRVRRMRDGRLAQKDVAKCYALLDAAVEWLKSIGRSDQWGEVPFSQSERLRTFMEPMFKSDGSYGWFIEDEKTGECVGVLIAGANTPGYAEQFKAEQAQVYIHLLVTSSKRRGENLGATLVGAAKTHARDQGISLVRVDCYNGNDGQLRRWYEKVGFASVGTFETSPWKGCVLEQRV
ncbi:hypothetical protein AURDEDRAFT_172603 [Auricularia subglabra TFB-10046 SS5]|nr:hypothetical protein AURDEDRAFT_172603 [Auricularia subglabra TFB-10046 SS5]